MRILWSSNAIWVPSGYGVQAKSLLPRLRQHGHEVAQFAWYGLQGGVMESDGIRIYPAANDPWGNDIIGAHVRNFQADLVISLLDIWVLPEDYANRCRPARWCCWFPVDHQPCPPLVAEMAQTADYPVTYSQFGHKAALTAGVTNARYIPHGVETSSFCPGSKAEARKRLKIPESAYLVSMVAANKGQPSRKGFPENLQAFAKFQARHPDAMLYLHSLRTRAQHGVDFDLLLAACGIPQESVRFVDQYLYSVGLPPEYMIDVYRASDVLLAASQSEGFGIPIVEAQACGCPVVSTDFTSMPELTMNGIAAKPDQLFWTPMDSWAAMPSVANITDALETLWHRHVYRESEDEWEAQAGVEFVRENYDWDVLAHDWWLPFLAEVEKDIQAEAVAEAVCP